jgi:hypothetical protein
MVLSVEIYDREEAAERPAFLHQMANATKVFSEKSKAFDGNDDVKNFSKVFNTDKYFFHVFRTGLPLPVPPGHSSTTACLIRGPTDNFWRENLELNERIFRSRIFVRQTNE